MTFAVKNLEGWVRSFFLKFMDGIAQCYWYLWSVIFGLWYVKHKCLFELVKLLIILPYNFHIVKAPLRSDTLQESAEDV